MPHPYPSWQEAPYSSDWSPNTGRDHPHAPQPPPQLRMHPAFASNQYPHQVVSEPQGARPTRRRRRPTVSYSNIIITAIRNSPQQRLRLSEIYEYVSREIPQMMGDDKGWQNTVRHNLSHNRCFRRETPSEASAHQSPSGSAEEDDESLKGAKPKKGKGGYWVLVPEELEDSMSKPKKNPNDRRRRKNTNMTEVSRSSSLMNIDRDVASMVIADSNTPTFSSSTGQDTGHVSDESDSDVNSVYSRSDNSDSEPETERDGDRVETSLEQGSHDEGATVRHPGMSLQNMLN
ncbi:Forkhead box protein I1 [Podila clonocystis]|nr:Forkhead box protein I1 [Podila clonocystis]